MTGRDVLLLLALVGAVAGGVLAVEGFLKAPGWKPAAGVAMAAVGIYSTATGF